MMEDIYAWYVSVNLAQACPGDNHYLLKLPFTYYVSQEILLKLLK